MPSERIHEQRSLARNEAEGRRVRYVTLQDGTRGSLYEVEVFDLATRYTGWLAMPTTDMDFPLQGQPFDDFDKAMTFFEAQVSESLKAGFLLSSD